MSFFSLAGGTVLYSAVQSYLSTVVGYYNDSLYDRTDQEFLQSTILLYRVLISS